MSEYRRKLADLARTSGFELEVTSGGHYRLVREGSQPIIAPYSPRNGWRTIKNVTADIRRRDKAEEGSTT